MIGRALFLFSLGTLAACLGTPIPALPPDASPPPPADAAPPPSADLAVADLAAPPNDAAASPICPGSALAAVACARAIVEDAYASCVALSPSCNGPVAGQCGQVCRDYCWPTGTRETYFSDGTTQQFGWGSKASSPYNCVVGAIDAAGVRYLKTSAGMLAYDPSKGTVTCADGSSHPVGADFGGCPELAALFEEPKGCDPNGACP